MTGKKLARFAGAGLLALLIAVSAPGVFPAPAQASSLSQLQSQQQQLKDQQKQIAGDLAKLKNDKAQQVAYKNQLDAQIKNTQAQIDNLGSQVTALDSDIRDKEAQIASKQVSINTNYQKLKERLRALYLTGEASNLEVILNAKNIMDLADKTEILQVITEHDTDLINTLKSEMESVRTQKQQIEQNRAAVASAKSEYDQKQKDLQSLENQASQVIVKISSDQAQKQAESVQNAAQQKKLDQAVDDWFADYYRKQQEQQQQNRGGGGGGGSNVGGNSGGGGGYVSQGQFTWPVPSCTHLSRGFGDMSTGSFHKGVDIAGAGIYGAQIVAADSGRVIMAGWGNYGTGYGGYGNVVAIDHGGGYSTLYGHMSSVAVSTGQQVTKGQTIGAVGSTGDSTGPHCHFEIRVNGVAQNPMNWFG